MEYPLVLSAVCMNDVHMNISFHYELKEKVGGLKFILQPE